MLFWKIVDPNKAALDVADYQSAISWASQTALRDVIGKTMLCDMLEGGDKISSVLRTIIDERTEPWGINVTSVDDQLEFSSSSSEREFTLRSADRPSFFVPTLGRVFALFNPRESRPAAIPLANSLGVLSPRAL